MGSERRDILFLCVANSARSQMAEGIARQLAPASVGVHSAGSEPGRVNPHALRVMEEIGIDLSGHWSKAITDIPLEQIATVVTLCADEVCPVFPGDVERLHWPLADPAGTRGAESEILEAFRRVRDQLREKLPQLFAS